MGRTADPSWIKVAWPLGGTRSLWIPTAVLRRSFSSTSEPTMATSLRIPLLLLAALALALTVSPATGASPGHPPRLLGGLEEADVNEEGVRRAVDFAVSEYNKGSNDAYHSRAMKVVRARKQVRVRPGGVSLAGLPLGGRTPAFPALPSPPSLLLPPWAPLVATGGLWANWISRTQTRLCFSPGSCRSPSWASPYSCSA